MEKVIKGLELIIWEVDNNSMWLPGDDDIRDAITLLKEQEAMVKPTKCPCGELFDAKDSSFCPKCGCAYSELSGRYTNIGR